MNTRAVFYTEDDARAVVGRLVSRGFTADVARERFAGEDDDEDHAWAVVTDAPRLMLLNLLEEYDGWLDETATPPVVRRPQPLDLPRAPKRIKNHFPVTEGRATSEVGVRASVTGPTVAPMDQRMLLVHAHPDDETIGQGATMAKYVARGTQVTLVTCTLGEEGEVLIPELSHLASEHDDQLGQHRIAELALAMKELGVTDHRFLGGAGTYRDSGMVWHEEGHATVGDEVKEGTFWRADLLEASNYLVEIIREVRPQVLVTYDEFGGYGHPDHIQAHRVATYAASLAAVPSYRADLGAPWDIAKIYWGAMSESRMREALRVLRASGDTTTFEGMEPEGPLPPFITPDENLATCVDANDFVGAKLAAMKAHATQIAVDGPFFALSNKIGNQVWGTESYRLARGVQGPTDENGLETDLFAGL